MASIGVVTFCSLDMIRSAHHPDVAFGGGVAHAGCTTAEVFMGEPLMAFLLVAGLCIFLNIRQLRPYTPALFPFLYAMMVYAESPVTGTSTNPARSLGPAIIS